MLPALFSLIANDAVMILGIWLIMQGKFSLGAMQMFLGFLGSFMSPAMTLISAGQTIKEMRTQMERVEDVMENPSDVNVLNHVQTDDENLNKLRGNIEMKNVTFGYSPLSEPIISDFSISMKPGSRVAFVGSSGCGKSTLIRLLLGFEKPQKDAIFYDGKDLSKLELQSLDEMGCTRIVIAHRLSTIRHCDRILVLEGGSIIEDGTYDSLIAKNGCFAELVNRQRLDNNS